jgi:hypothetical protein
MSTPIIELRAATPNGDANWDEFNEQWKNDVREKCSDLAIFFTTNEVHVPPRVVPTDYEMPPPLEGQAPMPDLTPANLTTRRLTCETRRDEIIIKNTTEKNNLRISLNSMIDDDDALLDWDRER